jgi:D-beta-D-heptose 7-phosphate kinase/D-beta-D-heptose 1-phosphate adenosyltransferase
MPENGLRQRLQQAIEQFPSVSILVVGDIMLDQFVWGEVSRISPEAPVPVVDVQDETFLLGGAANVAHNLRSLNAGSKLAGLIGRDNFGMLLKELSERISIDTHAIIQDRRPTTLKTRIVARGQQVVRVDREDRFIPSEETLKVLIDKIKSAMEECQGIIVSDYNKGAVSKGLMTFLTDRAKDLGKTILVDPKPPNYDLYREVSILTPNEKEAEAMAGMRIEAEDDLGVAAERIASDLELDCILITRGAKGMSVWQRHNGIFSIPTMAREVFDVTGAGDTVIAVMALGIVLGLKPCEAAYIANIAAGIVVGKIGTATVNREELLDALNMIPDPDIQASGC